MILQILIGAAGFLIALVLLLLILLLRARRQKAESEEELEELRAQPPVMIAPEAANGAGDKGGKDATEEEKTVYGRLIIIEGIEGDEIPLNEEEFLIGRRAENGCHWVIDQPFISPRHCQITHRAGSFTVRDLNSKNGVFINGERIPREREVIVPIGSEVAITERIKVELWDPNTVVNLETRRSGQTSVHHTTRINSAQADLVFRPLPGIQYAEDDGSEVDDSYSPL
jgi:pSer/pThr/pTyr-binding forkhead associated (FHA) protein